VPPLFVFSEFSQNFLKFFSSMVWSFSRFSLSFCVLMPKRSASDAGLSIGGRKGAAGYKRGPIGPRLPSGAFYKIPPNLQGFVRRAGNYGRYGASARLMGLRPEVKFFDTSLSIPFDATGEASTTAATGGVCLIPQGDTENTRDGRIAFIKSIQLRGIASFVPAAAATASTNIYLYVILDQQCNGAYPALTDIFTSTVMATNMLNLSNSGRFRILKKIKMNLSSMAGVTAAYNNVTKPIEWFKSCNIKLDFSSTTGAITEIRSNNICFAMGSDNQSDDTVTFTGVCRLRFVG